MPAQPPDIPDDLRRALAATPAAAAVWHRLAPSHRSEYVAWIDGARRDDTRARRIASTVARLASPDQA